MSWNPDLGVNPSTLKRILFVLHRERNLPVKNATGAAWNARDPAPRTALCALLPCCCTPKTAAACSAAMPPTPPLARSAVTARKAQVRGGEAPAKGDVGTVGGAESSGRPQGYLSTGAFCVLSVPGPSHALSQLISGHYRPHFTDAETKTQKG